MIDALGGMPANGGSLELRALAGELLNRWQFMRQAGITFGTKRDFYEIFGYQRTLSAKDYRDRYERGGLAGTLIDIFPDATWRGEPAVEIIEDEDPKVSTELEQQWVALEKRLNVCATLQRTDKLSLLSTYAALLIGAGSTPLDQELPRGKGPDDLLYLQPYLGGAALTAGTTCHIHEFESDRSNPRFGQPKSYKLKREGVDLEELNRPVHWSRILHVAEGCLENEVYGKPGLQVVWNLLDDLDKVTGGGSEAFWIRANQGTVVNVDKDAALTDPEKEAMKTQVEEFHHQMRRFLVLRKAEIQSLGSDVANFSNPADAIITQIAGTKRIPKRILTGSEMGELASSQDRENFKDQVNGRQSGYAGPFIVRRFVDRLITYGYLVAPKAGADAYVVRWPHTQTLTEAERADGAAKWAGVNAANGKPVFAADEIRDKWYGMEPLPEEEVVEPPAVEENEREAKDDEEQEPGRGRLRAAEEAVMVDILEQAIRVGNTDVIDAILGVEHA